MPTPAYPFQGYESEDADYRDMMNFIIRVESIQAEALGEWMMKEFRWLRSVIDIGCGPGIYLLPYQRHGCEIYGVDACTGAGGLLMPFEFGRWDLRFPFYPPHLFDLAICFEVAEHLKEEYSDVLLDSVSRSADLVLWTAAVPGQGGTFHYNEQPHGYWLDKFKALGYSIHSKQPDLRKFLSQFEPHRDRGEVSGWLLDNSFLLCRQ